MIRPLPSWTDSGLLHRGGDFIAVQSGRLAARLMGMADTARERGIVAERAPQQDRFEGIIGAFRDGYAAGLAADSPAALAGRLDEVENSLRGFAYEGAGMALATREAVNPWRRPMLRTFLQGPAAPFTYLVHVGVGWTYGLVPGARRLETELDPLLRWLALDGLGFREYFFASAAERDAIAVRPGDAAIPARLRDQGVGGCLWFVAAADPDVVGETIGRFDPKRRSDLWAGVGLACVYAGEPAEAELKALAELAGVHDVALAQGAAFAAKALDSGGQLAPRHDTACRLLCGMTAAEAARVTDEALMDLPSDATPGCYQQWRHRIQARFRSHHPASIVAGRAYEYRHVVTFEDTNAVGNVYYASYVTWQGRVREMFLRDHVPQVFDDMKHGLVLSTLNVSCKYRDELVAFNEVLIRLKAGPTAGSRMTLYFEYWNVSGPEPVLAAEGTQQIRCLRREGETEVPVQIPGYFLKALESFGAEPGSIRT